MKKALNKAQKEKLRWYFTDGVRDSNGLSMGQRETLEEMKLYEDMDSDIDRYLDELQNGKSSGRGER